VVLKLQTLFPQHEAAAAIAVQFFLLPAAAAIQWGVKDILTHGQWFKRQLRVKG
jgi:hypothetical protein